MQRLEQQQRKEMNKIKESYNSLMECCEKYQCGDVSITKCDYCNKWYDADDGYEEGGGEELDEFGCNSTYACWYCMEDGTVKTYKCWVCEEIKKGKAYSFRRGGGGATICKFCYFNNIYKDVNFTQIQKYNKVIEELKKKFE